MESYLDYRNINFEFNGNAGEYFKIWIVNIALTILTLGIYSAWAKVRTRRYFYGNTTLDGSSFDYLADPLAILKGRMIVFAFIMAYIICVQFLPALKVAFVIIYMLALPWMIIKSMQFNLRNTAYRNIRFNFDGKIKEAVFIFIFLPVITMFTLGLSFPYLMKRLKQFSVVHSSFGTSRFDFHARTIDFFTLYFKAIFIPVFIGIIAAVAIPAYNSYVTEQQENVDYIQTEQSQDSQQESTAEPEIGECSPDGLNQDDTSQQLAVAATMVPVLLSMAFYLLIVVYIQTRIANLVLCKTALVQHKLNSCLRVRNMFYIYFTNILATIASVGLLIPWCRIRLVRYRLQNTALIAYGDIDKFITNEQSDDKATAGEFADAFDLDLGF